MFINKEFTPMINKFLIESFVNKKTEEEIKESRFYKKYQYSKNLVESLKDNTGLHSATIASFLEKRKKKIKTFFDLEATPEPETIEVKIEGLKFIIKGFDFENNTNNDLRNKVIKKHNEQYIKLLFESGFSELIEEDNVKDLLSKTTSSFDHLQYLDENGFNDLASRRKNLKKLIRYHATLQQEVIDAIILEIETEKDENYITEFGEYNFMISSKIIQSILKYKASKETGISRVRQLKTLRQKAGKFKIGIKKSEGSKFTDINLKDLLTTTKERDAYKKSIHSPILANINFFMRKKN